MDSSLFKVWLSELQVQKADPVISSERVILIKLITKSCMHQKINFHESSNHLFGLDSHFLRSANPVPLGISTWEGT